MLSMGHSVSNTGCILSKHSSWIGARFSCYNIKLLYAWRCHLVSSCVIGAVIICYGCLRCDDWIANILYSLTTRSYWLHKSLECLVKNVIFQDEGHGWGQGQVSNRTYWPSYELITFGKISNFEIKNKLNTFWTWLKKGVSMKWIRLV